MDPVIVADGVVKRYGTSTALAGASVAIGGGVTGLLGANGAGKTTLLGMVLGLHQPDAGSLARASVSTPARPAPRSASASATPPSTTTCPGDMSRLRPRPPPRRDPRPAPPEAINRACDVLWQVGLGEERFRPVGTMSTGQRQRVKLAAGHRPRPARWCCSTSPPTASTPSQRDEMLALIRRIGTEFGIDVVLSSHLLEEVERICDQVVILAGGRGGRVRHARRAPRRRPGAVIELDDGVDAVVAALAAWPGHRGAPARLPPRR